VARAQLDNVVRHIRRLAAGEAAEGRTSQQLLQDFLTRHDETAFAALVRKHGPVVMGVCRHVLHHLQDAEDAFQGTFLVLARKAGSIRNGESLASWLHGVAFHTAMRAKRDLARRRLHERQAKPMSDAKPSWDLALQELQAVVDEEVQRLPEKYRAPFVLCCLENKSKAEAAAELGWKVGTVSSRLDQARKRLQQRLTRRGVTLSAVLGAAALSQRAGTAAVPAGLARTTVQAALRYGAGKTAAAGSLSPGAALAEGVIKAMFTTKIKIATVLVLAAALTAGIGALTHPTLAAKSADSQQTEAAKQSDEAKKTPAARDPARPETDRIGEKTGPAISGRILGPDGKPFPGAKLYVNAHLSEAEPLALATTDAAGRFHVKVPSVLLTDPKTGMPSYGLSVLATAEGYGPGAVSVREGEEAGELELRLVKDDVPLVGRLLDLEGNPVVGAKVSIRSIRAVKDGDLTRMLQDLQQRVGFWGMPYVVDVVKGPIPRQPKTVATDAGGRFRITGIGRERLVDLHFEAPSIAVEPIMVMTRPAETFIVPRWTTIYGAEFRVLAKPSRPITGTVREKGSDKPLAGVRVNGRAVTDAKGHYELHGMAKSDTYTLFAVPAKGELYFLRGTQVADKAGLGPLTADLEMVPGIPFRGRVTDKVTGKPVRGYVGYFPIYTNPDAAELTRHGYGGEHLRALSEAPVGPGGSFACCVLPGPGIVAFRTPSEGYLAACVNPKTVFKDLPFAGDERLLVIDHGGGGGPLAQDQFQAIALINPAKDTPAIAQDLTVEPASWVSGTVLGPDDKPRTGVRVVGLSEPVLKMDRFTVRGINPGAPRRLYFYHDAERLVGTLLVKGNEKELLTVRLQPWGTITGRLVTDDNQSLGPVVLFASNRDPSRIGIPGRLHTDRDGNFRIEGLIPGVRYTVFFTNNRPDEAAAAVGYLFQQLSVKPGEKRDLGTTKGKRFPGN
jgi:RNA polymerase sigma factor (sigma-70 family)